MNDDAPLIIEHTLPAVAAKVWSALTNHAQMKKWYFSIDAFEPVVGYKFSFTGGDGTDVFVHHCQVTEAIPTSKLAYSWAYEGFPGHSVVCFELLPDGHQTRLRLTHSGLETFPSNNLMFSRHSFAAGWNFIISNSLHNYLVG